MFPGDVRFAFIYDGEIKENEEGGKKREGESGKRGKVETAMQQER